MSIDDDGPMNRFFALGLFSLRNSLEKYFATVECVSTNHARKSAEILATIVRM